MRLRTRLILALLLLSAVPLAAIVFYNYASAQRAVRISVQAEADQLTRAMEARLGTVREEVRERLERLGSPLVARYFGTEAVPGRPPRPAAPPIPNGLPLPDLGALANLLRSIEVEPPETGDHDDIEDAQHVRELEVVVLTKPLIRHLAVGGTIAGLQAVQTFLPEALRGDREEMEVLAEDVGSLLEEVMQAAAGPVLTERAAEARDDRVEALAERLARRFGGTIEDDDGVEDDSDRVEHGAETVAPLSSDRPTLSTDGLLLDLETTVRVGDRIVGRLRPTLDPEAVLQRVMGPLERSRGEIPFAIGPDGTLLVLEEADRVVLEGLDVESLVVDHEKADDDGSVDETEAAPTESVTRQIDDEWAIVVSAPQPGGIRFGIASPVGESLALVRAAAARTLAAGLGLMALAALGVLPLARRMTGDLEHLTRGVQRIASGDLDTAVEVRSTGEIAQLAGAFNRMAEDLRANQVLLVDQACKERSLADELERKDEELEAARRFQLSMLPRSLPDHPSLTVAVAMRTATEVGGDYYDFDVDQAGVLTVAIGDATGHGATAGRMVTVVKSLFSAYSGSATSGSEPAGFLADANRTVRRMDLGRMAMALSLARFDGDQLTVASAGMPPALVLRRDGSVEEISLAGMPLGGLDRTYDSRTVPLAAGELVVLSSDGLPEQPDEVGDPLGYAAIRRHLSEQPHRSPQAVVDGLLELLEAMTDGNPPADDVTFVAVARNV